MTGAAARRDGRAPDQLRPLKIELGVNVHAEGSCLIEMGRTRVWITASVEDRVPAHRRGSGQGWITAEYSMLPRATHDRGAREAIQGRLGLEPCVLGVGFPHLVDLGVECHEVKSRLSQEVAVLAQLAGVARRDDQSRAVRQALAAM